MRLAPSTEHPVAAPGLGLVLLLALATACEPTEPMSHPFQRVPVASAPADGAAPSQPVADDRFADFDQAFRVSSEELSAMREQPDEPPAEPPPEAEAPAEPPAAPASPAQPQLQPTTPSAPGTMAPVVAQLPAAPLGWAVRLVSTIPEAQPPRAILGLPSGREIVVTPGSMVPDAGLVVLSIGTRGVQVARVQATGDHATVDAINLSPQY